MCFGAPMPGGATGTRERCFLGNTGNLVTDGIIYSLKQLLNLLPGRYHQNRMGNKPGTLGGGGIALGRGFEGGQKIFPTFFVIFNAFKITLNAFNFLFSGHCFALASVVG